MSRTNLVIPQLTDEHRATFPAFVDEWIAIGRSTDEIDYANSIRAIHLAWGAAGLRPPFVLFTRSPIEALFARDVLSGVRSGVRSGVESGVGSGWRVPADWWSNCLYGCHDASWLAYYAWFHQHGLAGVCAPLEGLMLLARSAGWTLAHENIAIVSDRPLELHDELTGNVPHERRLHNADGPAVSYTDGWAVWSWHGTNVPAWVIKEPTVELIAAERNTEIRRCAIESFGWDRYLAALGVGPVDECDDPGNPGRRLRLFNVPPGVYGGDVRLLVMENASLDRDGSRRTFAETVPASCGSALEAAAWQFQVDPAVYARLGRAS